MTNPKWREWNGGKFIPVPESAIGSVKLRNGRIMNGVAARNLLWGRPKCEFIATDNFRNGGEIVAYCFDGEAA